MAAAGRDILFLSIGEPDVPTPPELLSVAAEDWERIRLDVETVAVLSADLAETPPGHDELFSALHGALRN